MEDADVALMMLKKLGLQENDLQELSEKQPITAIEFAKICHHAKQDDSKKSPTKKNAHRGKRVSSPPRNTQAKKDPVDLLLEPGSPADLALVEATSRKKRKEKKLKKKRGKNMVKKIARKGKRRIDKHIKPQGNPIDIKHQQYWLTYGMMLGIRTTVGKESSNDRLIPHDFAYKESFRFPPQGGRTMGKVVTPPHKLPRTFKFKDYAPAVFKCIRSHFGLSQADYLLSLCHDFNFIEFQANSKSGQFFFYSHDGKYMIKTQTKEESKFLRQMLPQYYKHIRDNPNTLLTRFYGMHRVKMHDLQSKIRFVIMGSVFYTEKEVHRIYDLKGSRQGRESTEKEKQSPGCVRKDNDLVEDFEKKGFKMCIGVDMKTSLLKQLEADTAFLRDQWKTMDYSLLLGIHTRSREAVKGVNKAGVKIGQGDRLTDAQIPGIDSATDMNMNLSLTPASSISNTITSAGGGQFSSSPPKLDFDVLDAQSLMETRAATAPAGMMDSALGRTSPSKSSNGGVDVGADDSDYGISSGASDEGSDYYDDDSSDDETGGSHSNIVGYFEDEGEHREVNYQPPLFNAYHGGICGKDNMGNKTDEIYFVGVIDILQQYNGVKKVEHFFKGFKYDRSTISAVDPRHYARRFNEFMTKYTA